MAEKKQSAGAAWVKTTPKGEVINIVIGDKRYSMWKNSYKKKSTEPDYRLYEDTYEKKAPTRPILNKKLHSSNIVHNLNVLKDKYNLIRISPVDKSLLNSFRLMNKNIIGGGAYGTGRTAGSGGTGGGGNGYGDNGASGTVSSGTANTGGGGGGRYATVSAGQGGSGVVIIKISSDYTATFSGGVTQTVDSGSVAGYKIYTVTATSTTSETVTFS